jgi:hypothetical protein
VLLLAGLAGTASAGTLANSLLDPIRGRAQGDVLVAELVRTAELGADFPTVATTPSVVYSYNSETGSFERSSASLGPSFVERGETVGRNRLTVSMSYLHVDFQELDGDSLDGLSQVRVVPFGGTTNVDRLRLDDFSLVSDVFAFSATYGVTDALDVNLVLPLVYTTLSARGAVSVNDIGTPLDVDDSAFGVGDLLVRAKYRFTSYASPVQVAGGLALRIPTGEEEDFQGLGDTILTPFAVVSRTFAPVDLHASFGVDYNADDLERTRLRWGAGATVQVIDRLALLFDFFGSHGLQDDDFTTQTPVGPADGVIARSDNVFAAPGIKVQLLEQVIVFASAIVPLTSDGLQADVIPAGGFELTF